MKNCISLLCALAVLSSAAAHRSNAAIQVYDLKSDWSDTENPNGPWSYRDNGGALLSNDPVPWSYTCETVESIARITEAYVLPGILELGDIYVLPAGSCGKTVRWTAPSSGTVDLSGNTWGCAGIFWRLQLNGNIISSSEGYGGGTRIAPLQFSAGSGGSAALQSIAVQADDQVELVVWGYLMCGDSTPDGLNFTVTLTTESLDSVAAIKALAKTVAAINLQNGIENSLDSKLDAALNALSDANLNNDAAACNSLAAFINAVEAQRDNKISRAQADQLISSAHQIQTQLNCAN